MPWNNAKKIGGATMSRPQAIAIRLSSKPAAAAAPLSPRGPRLMRMTGMPGMTGLSRHFGKG